MKLAPILLLACVSARSIHTRADPKTPLAPNAATVPTPHAHSDVKGHQLDEKACNNKIQELCGEVVKSNNQDEAQKCFESHQKDLEDAGCPTQEQAKKCAEVAQQLCGGQMGPDTISCLQKNAKSLNDAGCPPPPLPEGAQPQGHHHTSTLAYGWGYKPGDAFWTTQMRPDEKGKLTGLVPNGPYWKEFLKTHKQNPGDSNPFGAYEPGSAYWQGFMWHQGITAANKAPATVRSNNGRHHRANVSVEEGPLAEWGYRPGDAYWGGFMNRKDKSISFTLPTGPGSDFANGAMWAQDKLHTTSHHHRAPNGPDVGSYDMGSAYWQGYMWSKQLTDELTNPKTDKKVVDINPGNKLPRFARASTELAEFGPNGAYWAGFIHMKNEQANRKTADKNQAKEGPFGEIGYKPGDAYWGGFMWARESVSKHHHRQTPEGSNWAYTLGDSYWYGFMH